MIIGYKPYGPGIEDGAELILWREDKIKSKPQILARRGTRISYVGRTYETDYNAPKGTTKLKDPGTEFVTFPWTVYYFPFFEKEGTTEGNTKRTEITETMLVLALVCQMHSLRDYVFEVYV